jgi:hypothetical protein
MGLITKGMGVVFKHIKKAKPTKTKLKTVYKVKPSIDISVFKKSKKHGLAKKLDVWANRESGKLVEQVGKGVNIKYTKKGKPYVPKGTKPSRLTKAKGFVKLTSPIAGGLTAGAIHAKIKDKK